MRVILDDFLTDIILKFRLQAVFFEIFFLFLSAA